MMKERTNREGCMTLRSNRFASLIIAAAAMTTSPFATSDINRLPDGRLMKWRENNPRTPEEKYLSLTWKGWGQKRAIPSSPPQ